MCGCCVKRGRHWSDIVRPSVVEASLWQFKPVPKRGAVSRAPIGGAAGVVKVRPSVVDAISGNFIPVPKCGARLG